MMLSETHQLNGHLPLEPVKTEARRGQTEDWMRLGRPISEKRRRVHVVITPTLAQRWLDNANTKNRTISDSLVAQYGIDMLDGRWKDNGDAIRFSKTGTLLDGQHRLQASAKGGVVFSTDVIFGLDDDALGTIDIGRARKASDIAHISGAQNSVGACAMAQMLLVHRQYGIDRMHNADCKPTKTEVVDLVLKDARIPTAAGRAASWGKRLTAPRVLAFCYYLFSAQDQKKCDAFFNSLSTGTGLAVTSPAYLLRERLIANRASKAKLPLLEVIALFFKAWAAYRDGKQIRVLRWRTTGPTPEPFPSI